MPLLSVIIPFGLSREREYIENRVLKKTDEFCTNEEVEYIFVEGFSSYRSEIGRTIRDKGHIYIKDDKQHLFSQGRCRNLGASYANSPVLLFLDVDYYLSSSSLKKIIEIIKYRNFSANINQILCLPVVFLTQEGTSYLLSKEQSIWDMIVQDDLISGKNRWIKFFAPNSTSSIVVNRHRFLEIGGNDENFIGHGYEDFDLLARILYSCVMFEKMPKNLLYDSRNWNFKDYKGFRAWFSILGYEMGFYGVYLYHLWHVEPNQNSYMDNKEINHRLFYKHLKEHKRHTIKPLQIASAKDKKILLICRFPKDILNILRDVSVYLGDILHIREDEFFVNENFNEEYFLFFLEQKGIDTILFPNPYSNRLRKIIYGFVRENNIPYLCFDRGALPDSWFFDYNGFNADSLSYQFWNKELKEEEIIKTKEYISYVLEGNNYLEKQDKRQEGLIRKLQLTNDKKIVFIPLQKPDDTVIKYFSNTFDYESFLQTINEVAKKLANTHIFVAKKHPLGNKILQYRYKNIVFILDDTNIIDCLELCDVVVCLNSGVGVYAMMLKKPCIVCAEAFYFIEGVNFKADSQEKLLKLLTSRLAVNEAKMIKFIHYLVYEFYSFGKTTYRRYSKNGELYSKAVNIDFYELNLRGKKVLSIKPYGKTYYSLKSLIYKAYAYELKYQNIFVKSIEWLVPDWLQMKISHTKFYRLFRKLLSNPRYFIRDSKKLQFLNKILYKKDNKCR
ncbi:capsular biosynthesis protein [Helicobacter valdiviensis]|uniref:Capsular biosynthesis protein n=1 Tax=Helicobacter valdiviensis TaxID=1458358 RepID=A0A2W6NF77_9HELI|nr:galactosyltransferase-related protein [Helicobacter valdiviensis]PZT47650.1 capsular biosynthesis protein [Helicobacter valdiviensis]